MQMTKLQNAYFVGLVLCRFWNNMCSFQRTSCVVPCQQTTQNKRQKYCGTWKCYILLWVLVYQVHFFGYQCEVLESRDPIWHFPPSTTEPSWRLEQKLDFYLDCFHHLTQVEIISKGPSLPYNLSCMEHDAKYSFKINPSSVTKEADKGTAVVVRAKLNYILEIET